MLCVDTETQDDTTTQNTHGVFPALLIKILTLSVFALGILIFT